MDIEVVLKDFENTNSNLSKMWKVWQLAKPHIPVGPSVGTSPQYEVLRNTWDDLRAALPMIDGWKIDTALPDIALIGEQYRDAAYYGLHELAWDVEDDRPEHQLLEYHRKLQAKKRKVFRADIDRIAAIITRNIGLITNNLKRDSTEFIDNELTAEVKILYKQIIRITDLKTVPSARWNDFERHYSFSEGHDWHDIKEYDWPSILQALDQIAYSEFDPIEVTAGELNDYADLTFSGNVVTSINLDSLTAEDFESLMFDVLSSIPNYVNVSIPLKTNAPDQGKDITFSLRVQTGFGGELLEPGVLQAKHWKATSVSVNDIADTLNHVPLWGPPHIRQLIFATSGKFTSDAVQLVQKHNNQGTHGVHIEIWERNKLEFILMKMPEIVQKYRLTN